MIIRGMCRLLLLRWFLGGGKKVEEMEGAGWEVYKVVM